jgi:threonine aldolase
MAMALRFARSFEKQIRKQHSRRLFSSSSSSSSPPCCDLRSDPVTLPCTAMRSSTQNPPVGDDVMGEDPTVKLLEERMATTVNKESALFLPTGTMSDLCAILAHCDRRASEVVAGATSHLCLYEQGGMSTLGGVHSRQAIESDDGTIPIQNLRDATRPAYDDAHYPYTRVVCLENTHRCGALR